MNSMENTYLRIESPAAFRHETRFYTTCRDLYCKSRNYGYFFSGQTGPLGKKNFLRLKKMFKNMTTKLKEGGGLSGRTIF